MSTTTGTGETSGTTTTTGTVVTTKTTNTSGRWAQAMLWIEIVNQCVQIALAKTLYSKHRTWASKGPLIIQIPVFPVALLARPVNSMFLFSRNDTVSRTSVWVHCAFTTYILTSNLAVDVWGLMFRDWRFAYILPFVLYVQLPIDEDYADAFGQ